MAFFSLKSWWGPESRMSKLLIVSLLITSISAFFNLPYNGILYPIFFEQALGQTLGGNSLFPNATTSVASNQSIIPGLHVMSLVNGVKLTWIIISSDDELSVNLRYAGNGTAPSVSLLATALKIPVEPQIPGGTNASAYLRLEGSNTTSTGWVSPATIPVKVQGGMSLYDTDFIVVMVVPYTPPPAVSNSSSTISQ